jgi:phospholipase/lecithinase/hemolysin
MKRLKFFVLASVTAVLLATLPTSGAQIPDYFTLYAFGDSLVDNGNDYIYTKYVLLENPETPPSTSPHRTYNWGRFSNGYVGFEYLWWMLRHQNAGSPGGLRPYLELPIVLGNEPVNFGFGGSGTGESTTLPGGLELPGLKGQVGLFDAALVVRPAPSDALYAMFSGANDYLLATPAAPVDPRVIVANIVDATRHLYSLGAREFVIVNLPDLGAIPLVAGTPASPVLTRLTDAHNKLLRSAVRSLKSELPSSRITLFNAHGLFNELRTTMETTPAVDTMFAPPAPGEYPVSFCLFTDLNNCPDVPTFEVSKNFLFWDAEHPTTAVHAILAQRIYRALAR